MAEDSVSAPPEIAQRLADEMSVTSDLLVGVEHLPEILNRLAARAREITGADFAAISTFDEEGVLERFIYEGISERDAARLGHPPVGRGLLGELARHDRPLRLEDLQAYPGFTGWPEGHPDMRAFLGVPIRALGRTIGSLYMTRREGGAPFAAADELAASMMALQAAISVSTALARETRGRVWLLEERERIAHDLHDGIIQSLYSLGLEVDAYSTREDIMDDTRELLVRTVASVNAVIGELRTYITMLEAESPASSPELSRDLAYTIRQFVPDGVDTITNVSAPALQELGTREVEDLLYIAREAISNAVRHGHPTKLAIDLRQTPEEISLTVQDNGVGFDASNARTGFGTITMRTRATRLGATLSILPIPGMGTTVRISIPRGEHE